MDISDCSIQQSVCRVYVFCHAMYLLLNCTCCTWQDTVFMSLPASQNAIRMHLIQGMCVQSSLCVISLQCTHCFSEPVILAEIPSSSSFAYPSRARPFVTFASHPLTSPFHTPTFRPSACGSCAGRRPRGVAAAAAIVVAELLWWEWCRWNQKGRCGVNCGMQPKCSSGDKMLCAAGDVDRVPSYGYASLMLCHLSASSVPFCTEKQQVCSISSSLISPAHPVFLAKSTHANVET